MAESIANIKKAFPTYQVIHLNGAFHSDNHLGTVAILNNTLPGLKNTVISPARVENNNIPAATEKNFAQGDYIYLIQPLPARYLDQDKMNQSIIELIKKRKKEECTLWVILYFSPLALEF